MQRKAKPPSEPKRSTTEPHGTSMFSALDRDTGELDIPPHTVWPETDRGLMMPRRRQPASGTAATASTRNDAREPNSSPKKNDNAKPGLPRTTNHHLLRRLVSEPEVGVQAGIGVRCLVDRVVVQRRVLDRAVVD